MEQVTLKARYRSMREEMNRGIGIVTIISAIGAFTYGYDLNWWGAVLAQPYFNAVFGQLNTPLPSGVVITTLSTTQQSISSSVSIAGSMLGVITAYLVSKPFGYKAGFAMAATLVLAGSTVQITCSVGGHRFWQLVAGKIIVAMGAGVNAFLVPVYLSNCAPAILRGALVNTYSAVTAFAALIASVTIYALQKERSSKVWIIPCAIQMVTPVLTLCTLPLLKENPHWLILKGRRDEAQEVMFTLRRSDKPDDTNAEFQALARTIEEEQSKSRAPFMALWRGVQLKRSLAVIGVLCLQQAQGLGFLLGYLAILFLQLGLPNPFRVLVIIYALTFVFSCVSILYQDAIGRRVALLVGAASCAACMLCFSILSTIYPKPIGAAANACIAVIILWFVSYVSTWYSISYTAATEIPAVHLRPLTFTVGSVCSTVVGLMVIVLTPYLQNATYANLGGKIGYIYGSFSIFGIAFVYFLIPELKGRNLEVVDWLYESNIPIRMMSSTAAPNEALHEMSIPQAEPDRGMVVRKGESQIFEDKEMAKNKGESEMVEYA